MFDRYRIIEKKCRGKEKKEKLREFKIKRYIYNCRIRIINFPYII